jgi:hypothetical protein
MLHTFLGHNDVAGPLIFPECVEAIERALRRYSSEKMSPLLSHTDVPGGEFHVQGGALLHENPVFAIKVKGGDNGRPPKISTC